MRLSLLHAVPEAHKDGVWSAAWASTHEGGVQQLVTGSVDEEVRVWQETAAGEGGASVEAAHTFTGHSLGVVSVASVGDLAASSALDSVIRVWDLVTHETKVSIECPPSETWAIDFSPVATDTHLIAIAGGSSNKVKLWSVEEAKERSVLSMPDKVGSGTCI
jgi:WD repeat-containing protein 61